MPAATEPINQVVKVLVQNDYSEYLSTLQSVNQLLTLIAGLAIFCVVVLLCHYTYKFFRLFF